MHTRHLPANICIYCGTQEQPLTDEHIFPYAFNGNEVLPQASCKNCAAITSKAEFDVARRIYGSYRLRYNTRSRHKKKRPKETPVDCIDTDGTPRVHYFPAGEAPPLVPVLELPRPGILSGCPPNLEAVKVRLWVDTAELERAAAAANVKRISITAPISWRAVCRVLAKIAHSYTFAIFGGQGYEPLLNDFIFNESDDILNYVGCFNGDTPKSSLSIGIDGNQERILIYVKIVLIGGITPTYEVVSGRVTDLSLMMAERVRRSAVPIRPSGRGTRD